MVGSGRGGGGEPCGRIALNTKVPLCDADLYTLRVMPFGVDNGPEIFICTAHNINQDWQERATAKGITIDRDTNSRLIVDDIYNHAKDMDSVLICMEAQLEVSALRRLSLSLPKFSFFVERVEFVGVDISTSGNMPARSKHDLLRKWPKPKDIRDVASFIAFGMFYMRWIPWFEMRVKPLRDLTKSYGWDTPVYPETWPAASAVASESAVQWPEVPEDAWRAVVNGILSDPCLQRWNSRLHFYIRTDFCAKGMAFDEMHQPANDAVSHDAMRREMAGGACEFLKDPSKGSSKNLVPQL